MASIGWFQQQNPPGGFDPASLETRAYGPGPDPMMAQPISTSSPGGLAPSATTSTVTPSYGPGYGTFIGGTPFPGAGAGGSAGTITPSGQMDDATILQWLKQFAGMPGVDPSVTNDPGYWVGVIKSKGGLTAENAGYFGDRIKNPNQNRGEGAGGPAFGSFLTPYGEKFTPPTGTDDPGFQFALKEGTDALQRSAAMKGNLDTGGFMKDLAKYTTGAALQDYAGAFNRALQTYGTNYDVWRNNQNDPFNKLFAVTGMGANVAGNLNANAGSYGSNLGNLASAYGTNMGNLTTGIGNANAAGTIAGANTQGSAISSMADWYQHWLATHQGGPPGVTPPGSPYNPGTTNPISY